MKLNLQKLGGRYEIMGHNHERFGEKSLFSWLNRSFKPIIIDDWLMILHTYYLSRCDNWSIFPCCCYYLLLSRYPLLIFPYWEEKRSNRVSKLMFSCSRTFQYSADYLETVGWSAASVNSTTLTICLYVTEINMISSEFPLRVENEIYKILVISLRLLNMTKHYFSFRFRVPQQDGELFHFSADLLPWQDP